MRIRTMRRIQMNTQAVNFIRAMLQGLTLAGLFRRLDYPGAPKYAVDPRPVDEILRATGLDSIIRSK